MLNDMQIQRLEKLLEYYFKSDNFENIHNCDSEGYKWRAVKTFQEIRATTNNQHYFAALIEALSIGSNLLYRTNKDTLFRLIQFYEKEMRELFLQLEQGDRTDLQERLLSFTDGANELIKRDSSRKWQRLLPCDAMICLTFMKPNEYYFYRPFVMDTAEKFLNGEKSSYKSASEKACAFHDLCEDILSYINSEKVDLIKKYKERIKSEDNFYQDDSCHLLVQNILYALQYSGLDLKKPVSDVIHHYTLFESKDIFKPSPPEEKKQSLPSSSKNTVWKWNLEEASKREATFRRIGSLGEDKIYQELRRLYHSDKIYHISETDDSKHYDILCINDSGREIYVEVKTVSYSKSRNPRIYITQSEVDFSREHSKDYRLCIVLLNERAKKCVYQIFEGDITKPPLNLQYSCNGDRYVLEFEKINVLPI